MWIIKYKNQVFTKLQRFFIRAHHDKGTSNALYEFSSSNIFGECYSSDINFLHVIKRYAA